MKFLSFLLLIASVYAFEWTVNTPKELVIGQPTAIYWQVDNNVAQFYKQPQFNVWLVDAKSQQRSAILAQNVNSKSGVAQVTVPVGTGAGMYQVMVFSPNDQGNSRISNPFPVRAATDVQPIQPVQPGVVSTTSTQAINQPTPVQVSASAATWMTKTPTFQLATRPPNAPPGYMGVYNSGSGKLSISLFIVCIMLLL